MGEFNRAENIAESQIVEQFPTSDVADDKKMSLKEAHDFLDSLFLTENTEVDSNYREKVKESDGKHQEVHHMPADSISELSRGDGPAIVMEKADHRQTASCGNSLEAREYREQQAELIQGGNYRDAVQMDIDDIREKFGDKYDNEIAQLTKYVDKLEAEGKI